MEPLILQIINWFCILPMVFINVPQIYKIFSNKDVRGVSLRGYIIDCSRFTFSVMYHVRHHYALTYYLEYPFLAAQDLVLIPLILYYGGKLTTRTAITSIIIYFNYISILMFLPMQFIHIIQVLFIPLGIFGKFSHISALYQAKDSSNLSLFNWALNVATCLGRMITSYTKLGDLLLLLKFTINMSLNFTTTCMIIYYSPSRRKAKKAD